MNKNIQSASLSIMSLLVASTAVAGEFTDALTKGDAYADLRYRLEQVDQESRAEDAMASTLRTRVGYKTGNYKGFAAQLEVENVSRLGGGTYFDGVNGNSATHPTILDADTTEVNQAFISYTNDKLKTTAIVGRQAVNLDNQRFIGSVGFRQNDQTYDAAVLVNNSIEDVLAIYGYVKNVQRPHGDDHPAGSLDTETHLFNVAYTGLDFGKLTAYGYFLDIDDVASLSTRTLGLRFAGDTMLTDSVKALYEVEYAQQREFGANTASFSEDYMHVSPGVSYNGLTVKAGFEKLAGNGTNAFATPLATGHKFNGWADQFLATPANGLEDSYVSVAYKVPGDNMITKDVSVVAAYHEFEANTGGATYGNELDLKVAKKLNDNFSASVKFANYDADQFGSDTQKLWVTVGAKF